MSLFSPIHHTFAPLGDRRQRRRALAISYVPWRYKRGNSGPALERELQRRFGGDAVLFASGREALVALLRSLKLTPGEEVIIQGYTCVVVPNAIKAAGMVPMYADIDRKTLNLTVESVEKMITPKTRVIICQHTFGIPAPTEELRELCDKRSLILIEDCAHVLPDNRGPKEIGKYGDAIFTSFGRDKAVSGVTGGAVISKNGSLIENLKKKQEQAADLSWMTIACLLNYPVLYAWARPLYGIGLGKLLLWVSAKTGFLPRILTAGEKEGRMSTVLHRMPNVCAYLALDQLQRLEEINDHRRQLTDLYLKASAAHGWPVLHGIRADLPLQKFPMFMKNAEKIRRALRKKNIHLWDGWTGCVVCPASINLPETGYELGNDPEAEKVCEEILSLPTHPGMTPQKGQKLVTELQLLL